jgi:phosphate/sulfate permease
MMALIFISKANVIIAASSNQAYWNLSAFFSHPFISAVIGGIIAAFLSWLIYLRTRKYEIMRDHFEDLKNRVIKPWLKTLEDSKFDGQRFECDKPPSTYENKVDEFLYDDLTTNHYREMKTTWCQILELAKNRIDAFFELKKRATDVAIVGAANLNMNWFAVKQYEDLFTDAVLYYAGSREWPQPRSERESMEGKIVHVGKLAGWRVSCGDDEKESIDKADLVLQLIKSIALDPKLLDIKAKLMEVIRKLDELKEKEKWELRKTLYKKKLEGKCDCIK